MKNIRLLEPQLRRWELDFILIDSAMVVVKVICFGRIHRRGYFNFIFCMEVGREAHKVYSDSICGFL